MTETADAVVVGAGPAGSAAATLLAGYGRKVLLLDKDSFPRPKVCGEFLSADAVPSLERLGARDAVLRATAERMRSRISSAVFESRFAVGSSANTTAGRFASARAIATLCR